MFRLNPLAVALGCLLLASTCSAQTSAFSAVYNGDSQIIDVLDPTVPIVVFQTTTTGVGSFDLNAYTSQDTVNLATGVGNGTNRFIAGNGDVLLGQFSVQVIPTATPGVVDLLGTSQFLGGTGQFYGASGTADLTGSATFTSPTTATIGLNYRGTLTLVPESGLLALFVGAATPAVALLHRRYRR